MSVTIPDGVTSISDSVFDMCGSLTTVTIPSSVTHIGDTFYAARNLTIHVYSGSYAEQFCLKYDLKYVVIDPKPIINPFKPTMALSFYYTILMRRFQY